MLHATDVQHHAVACCYTILTGCYVTETGLHDQPMNKGALLQNQRPDQGYVMRSMQFWNGYIVKVTKKICKTHFRTL